MSLFEKKPLDVDKEIKKYLQFKDDDPTKILIKISTMAYLDGLKELTQPTKNELKIYMRGYLQAALNKEGLIPFEVGAVSGILSHYESKRQFESNSSFISKLETIIKKMEELDK